MASVNQQHFKAGGGNAAVKKLLAAQADAARRLTGASESSQQSTKPTEAQLARLRSKVAARGKAELDRQEKTSNRQEASETTYSGNKVYRNGKHIGNMVNGKLVKLENRDPKIKKVKYPVTVGTATDKPKEPEKKPEPEEKPDSELRTLTDNNRGGSSSGSSGSSGSSSSSSNSSSTPPRRGSATRGYTMKADLSKLLKDKPKTESKPDKPKSRLEKALSWASDKKNKDAWQGKKK